MQVSNLRPPACKAGALPAELITHNLFSRSIFVLRLNYMKNPRSCKVERLYERGFDICGDPYGNRTHDTAVKGRCLNRLTNGPDTKNDKNHLVYVRQGCNATSLQLSQPSIYPWLSAGFLKEDIRRYAPFAEPLVENKGFEPSTPCLQSRCSPN